MDRILDPTHDEVRESISRISDAGQGSEGDFI